MRKDGSKDELICRVRGWQEAFRMSKTTGKFKVKMKIEGLKKQ